MKFGDEMTTYNIVDGAKEKSQNLSSKDFQMRIPLMTHSL